MNRIYIAGKIGGLPEKVYKRRFANAEHGFKMLMFEVVNPVKLPHLHERTWKAYMKEDLKALKECDTCFMLNNWQDSKGAKVEHWFAARYGKTIIYQPNDREVWS